MEIDNATFQDSFGKGKFWTVLGKGGLLSNGLWKSFRTLI